MSRHQKKSIPNRQVRLAEQIKKDLAGMIQRELSMQEAGLVTLTEVVLTPDYAHARVFFTVIGVEPEQAQQVLSEKAGYFHALLFKLLHIHTVPTLHFIYDDHLERGMTMSALIDEVRAKDRQNLHPDLVDVVDNEA
ncbi:MAG: 30S ribosome-binding factor RbfA [Alcaligenaceae bacterium]|nr:30S ribosome-binding factor RbfA [Alcaligenaceae bacterium]